MRVAPGESLEIDVCNGWKADVSLRGESRPKLPMSAMGGKRISIRRGSQRLGNSQIVQIKIENATIMRVLCSAVACDNVVELS